MRRNHQRPEENPHGCLHDDLDGDVEGVAGAGRCWVPGGLVPTQGQPQPRQMVALLKAESPSAPHTLVSCVM